MTTWPPRKACAWSPLPHGDCNQGELAGGSREELLRVLEAVGDWFPPDPIHGIAVDAHTLSISVQGSVAIQVGSAAFIIAPFKGLVLRNRIATLRKRW